MATRARACRSRRRSRRRPRRPRRPWPRPRRPPPRASRRRPRRCPSRRRRRSPRRRTCRGYRSRAPVARPPVARAPVARAPVRRATGVKAPARGSPAADPARQTEAVTHARSDDTSTDPSGFRAEGSVASRVLGQSSPWPDRVVPSWADPVAAQASEAVGGPWGRHAVTGRALFWTPLRVCLLFATVVLALAWAKQSPCSAGDWSGSRQYTHFCYSDAVPLFGSYGLGDGALPYLDVKVEYPVLTGGFMALAAMGARLYDGAAGRLGLSPAAPPVQSYTVLTSLLLSLCALLLVRAVLGLAGRRPWDAAMIGLSPVLLVHAFTNWDLLAVVLTAYGMLAWA